MKTFKGRQTSTKSLVAIKLMEDLVDRIPVCQSGTYNRQDPTAFSKGKADFKVGDQRYRIDFNDCTWGIEIEISILKARFDDFPTEFANGNEFFTKEILISNFYLSPAFGPYGKTELIIRYKQKGIYKLLKQIVANYPSVRAEEENEIWIDPAGGVHCGYEGDPARMYE